MKLCTFFLLPLALNGWSERWGKEALDIFSVLVLLFGEEGACKFTANLWVNSEGCHLGFPGCNHYIEGH